jgi:hypothetical protein
MPDSPPHYDVHCRDYEGYKQEASQRLQFQHDFAQSALKSGVLVNGGAIVALFTFLGHNDQTVTGHLWWSFVCLVAGLAFALLAYAGAFLSQGYLMNLAEYRATGSRAGMGMLQPDPDQDENEKHYDRWGGILVWTALALAILGILAFVAGAGFALAGLSVEPIKYAF